MKIATWGSELAAWSPDFSLMLKQMKSPVIIDRRNVFSRELVEPMGVIYYGIDK